MEDEESEDPDGAFVVGDEGDQETPDFSQAEIAKVIQKVRKIVNWFNHSPKQTDKLRKYTKEDREDHQELTLKKDCKTRWSSLFYCLERFFDIRQVFFRKKTNISWVFHIILEVHNETKIFNRFQVRKVLSDEDKLDMFPDEDELNTIKSLFEALSIVEAGTRDLCAKKETLASADRVGSLWILK